MKVSTRVPFLLAAAAFAAVLSSTAQASQGDAKHSEQVIFAGRGTATFGGGDTAFGFAVHCEAESANKNAGNCTGFLYFHDLGLSGFVTGTESESGDTDVYILTVSTADGSIACTLTNPSAPVNGPNNTVTVNCSVPSGTATLTDAVVRVTAPPEH